MKNIQEEFLENPLYINKQEFSLSRKEPSEQEEENIDLLSQEFDEDFLSELGILLYSECSQ